MKYLKKYQRNICGVQYPMFSILKNKKYNYYLNAPWTKKAGDFCFYKSDKKSVVLNKYTLSILGVIYLFLNYAIFTPLLYLIYPLFMYIHGGVNFIRDGVNATGVRFFNWVNLTLVLWLSATLVYVLFYNA